MSFKFEKLSILVIEDTEPMLKLVASVLTTLGVGRVYTASDGNRGFDLFCSKKPDIVITDWHMSPMSGIQLIKKIRTDKRSTHKTVPVIMITGYSALSRVATARDVGSTEFLVKPFSAEGLARRIAYVINKPRDFVKAEQYFGPDRRRKEDLAFKGEKKRMVDANFEIETT